MIRAAGLGIHAAELKGRGDYVTAVDRESQQVILRALRAATPELPVLAEETGPDGVPPAGGAITDGWVVDPLDGTTNFHRGFPVVGVSVALLEEGVPVAGAVSAPFLGQSWHGARGAGAFDGRGTRLRVGVRPVAEAVVATGFPFRAPERRAGYLRVLAAVLARVEDGRRAGAAAIDLALVAAGVFDGFFELGLHAWDVAAGALLVTEAGGVVGDWGGGQGHLATGDILAGSPGVHAALLEAVGERSGGPS